jgi:hypothetical protein
MILAAMELASLRAADIKELMSDLKAKVAAYPEQIP